METSRGSVFLVLCTHVILAYFTIEAIEFVGQPEIERNPVKCPGRYCGRVEQNGSLHECGACPRGYRVMRDSVCEACTSSPSFYDWLYLGFMAMLAPAFHWFFIDFTNKRKTSSLVLLHVSALVECVTAIFITLLIMEPVGSLNIYSCGVRQLSDWYTMLYNPSPDYINTLHCTQEAVYPLYTIVMIYYAFCLLLMILFRPVLSAKLLPGHGDKAVYAALYFFPILVVLQAIFAGLIYYSFPYITIVISLLTSAVHFSSFTDQHWKYLLKQNVTNPRNIVIILCHWLLHAFGIIAITQLKDWYHPMLITLVPVPAVFYICTSKFTDPQNLDTA